MRTAARGLMPASGACAQNRAAVITCRPASANTTDAAATFQASRCPPVTWLRNLTRSMSLLSGQVDRCLHERVDGAVVDEPPVDDEAKRRARLEHPRVDAAGAVLGDGVGSHV